MNPIWILIGMGALCFLLHLTAAVHDDRRREAGPEWKGDRREELGSLTWALCLLPILPVAVVINMPDMLLTGQPLLWAVALGGSIVWLFIVIAVVPTGDPEKGRKAADDHPSAPVRQMTSRDMPIDASPSGGGSQDSDAFPPGGGVGS